jgi:hypothetical protein
MTISTSGKDIGRTAVNISPGGEVAHGFMDDRTQKQIADRS